MYFRNILLRVHDPCVCVIMYSPAPRVTLDFHVFTIVKCTYKWTVLIWTTMGPGDIEWLTGSGGLTVLFKNSIQVGEVQFLYVISPTTTQNWITLTKPETILLVHMLSKQGFAIKTFWTAEHNLNIVRPHVVSWRKLNLTFETKWNEHHLE